MSHIVDALAAELAERRRHNNLNRHAYLALARAILSDDQREPQLAPAADREPAELSAQYAA